MKSTPINDATAASQFANRQVEQLLGQYYGIIITNLRRLAERKETTNRQKFTVGVDPEQLQKLEGLQDRLADFQQKKDRLLTGNKDSARARIKGNPLQPARSNGNSPPLLYHPGLSEMSPSPSMQETVALAARKMSLDGREINKSQMAEGLQIGQHFQEIMVEVSSEKTGETFFYMKDPVYGLVPVFGISSAGEVAVFTSDFFNNETFFDNDVIELDEKNDRRDREADLPQPQPDYPEDSADESLFESDLSALPASAPRSIFETDLSVLPAAKPQQDFPAASR